MKDFNAKSYKYTVLEHIGDIEYYPLFIDSCGEYTLKQVSPLHCRSFLVGMNNDGRYIISKGNGLGFSNYNCLYTKEYEDDVWGLLRKKDAIRDYNCGRDIQALGIKTNQMECVLELDIPLYLDNNGTEVKPYLLQYNVECPYRIADWKYRYDQNFSDEINKWDRMNDHNFKKNHLVAANVLIRNLHILHENNILHNAITPENITWALELVDFEITHTPQHPYDNKKDVEMIQKLYPREILDTYKIIDRIAFQLDEEVDNDTIEGLFKEYGFDLSEYALSFKNK